MKKKKTRVDGKRISAQLLQVERRDDDDDDDDRSSDAADPYSLRISIK